MVGELTLEGKIESIEYGKSKNGNEFGILTVKGRRYSDWDGLIATSGAVEGDYVRGTYLKKGQYNNLKSLTKTEAVEEEVQATIPESTQINFAKMMDVSIKETEAMGIPEGYDKTKIALTLFIAKTKAR